MSDIEFGLRQFVMAEYNEYVQNGQDSFTAKANVINALLKEAEKIASTEGNRESKEKLLALILDPAINKLRSIREEYLRKDARVSRSIETSILKLKEHTYE